MSEPSRGGGRVLLAIDGLGNGGAERQFLLLVKNLPDTWSAQVCALGGGPFVGALESMGVPFEMRERRVRLDPRPAGRLALKVVRERPDVVHSWGWMCSAAVGPTCRILGIPLVDSTIRMGRTPPRRGLLTKLAQRWATIIVSNSKAGLEGWNVDPRRGRVIYNGFDPDRLRGASADADGDDAFKVVMTGRMVRAKDFTTLIGAARDLARSGPEDLRVILVGEGPDRPSLMEESRDLLEAGVASFPAPGLEVIGIVRQAHVGVLVSDPDTHAEGCSNSILEYMACGLPIVCSEGGGNRELVEDGVTGFVIPPRDPAALAAKLRWLRDHPDEARGMGERGRERQARDFSVESMVSGTIAVYEEVRH